MNDYLLALWYTYPEGCSVVVVCGIVKFAPNVHFENVHN